MKDGGKMMPDDLRDILAYVRGHRKVLLDAAIIGSRHTPGKGGARGAKKVALFAEAGMMW